jgi:hypothetical protein
VYLTQRDARGTPKAQNILEENYHYVCRYFLFSHFTILEFYFL